MRNRNKGISGIKTKTNKVLVRSAVAEDESS